jgi:cobalt-zinc-cadmium efflux system outer membrane protein
MPSSKIAFALACVCTLTFSGSSLAVAQSGPPLTLMRALQRAVAANPRLTTADRDVGVAAGRQFQAGAVPNPEISAELDNALGSGQYRGTRSAETTLQLSQLVELGGKRDARIAAGTAELEAARWQRASVRLEILSDTAVAFFSVLAAQRRIAIYDTHIAALQRLAPMLQRRVEAGASSVAETARQQLATDLLRADRERARTSLAVARLELATLMGATRPDFAQVSGNIGFVGQPPPFQSIRSAVESNPQLARFTALRAQADAELLIARLKPVPDLRAGVAWRHFNDTNDNAARLSLSMAIPLWDQNLGNIASAQAQRLKVDSERSTARLVLLLTLGRAYETLSGAVREIGILRSSALPNSQRTVEAMESGYGQGRFTLLELLDVQRSATEASIRELEALLSFHISLATIEGLTGAPLRVSRARAK